MVKRKWLCENPASQSMSRQQEPSPCNSQSPQAVSINRCHEFDRDPTNEDVDRFTQKPSDLFGDYESKKLVRGESMPNISLDVDVQENSDTSGSDGSKQSSPTTKISTIFIEKIAGDEDAVEDGKNHQADNANLKTLRGKLTAALFNVSIKDDLVKQHSKVAEEAVAGWEKAEKEATDLKQQLDATVESKMALAAQVSHLDEALRECVRQLRLGRDEQERKIKESLAERTRDLEHAKTLREELKRNVGLRKQLEWHREELEVMTIERDLSSNIAETASKQHLESIKKIAKLEAECRKLKSLARMPSLSNGHRSITVVAKSQSNGWASLDNLKGEKKINLMDDFLEMELLAALPDQISEKPISETENKFRAELKALSHRTAELEENYGRLEEEKAELEMALAQTQRCLDNFQVDRIEAQIKLEQLERDLEGAAEREQFYKTTADNLKQEVKLVSSQIRSLHDEIDKERALTSERTSRLKVVERELKMKEQESICNGDLKTKEIALAESQDCLHKSQAQLKELEQELQEAKEEKESLISEVDVARAQAHSMSIQIETLNKQLRDNQVTVVQLGTKVKESEKMCMEMESMNRRMQKEQALVEQLSTQVKEMERELRQSSL